MTFTVDPRICLITGKALVGAEHACCGEDHSAYPSNSGLLSQRDEKVTRNAFRSQMLGRYARKTDPNGYLRPLRIVEDTVDPAESSPNRVLPLQKGKGRREAFAAMLRRMFGQKA